ncbi:glycosyltransferase [Aerococcus sp.]|uniref:glycosyltransferase n=1 Tax=Aerococcus sp. TaxID=1872398 RepID=UPI0028A5E37C|nr:glycosyltransferase [Aerococcus sp.]
MIIIILLFLFAAFTIFWANIGYPLSILMLGKIFKKDNIRLKNYYPEVTIMIVAHNEEKVISNKLKNLENLNYPKDKLSILVASDNSIDETNDIVQKYIDMNPHRDISLYKAKKRMGKTNAQNEAQKKVKTDFLIMTDANALLDSEAVKEIISSFSDSNISYVTGQLKYVNSNDNLTSSNESTYWNLDLKIREIESRIQTITAGNGALYAVRNSEYYDFNPIHSHDSAMPLFFALNGKRAIANHDAIAYEKAGESNNDEYKRKVRMSRVILSYMLPNLKIFNVLKYKWFTYFYLGHRSSRYSLWLMHIILLVTNIILAIKTSLFLLILLLHLTILCLVITQHFFKFDNKYLSLLYYYFMTIFAQTIGVKNIITGNAKPFWEKAESTR